MSTFTLVAGRSRRTPSSSAQVSSLTRQFRYPVDVDGPLIEAAAGLRDDEAPEIAAPRRPRMLGRAAWAVQGVLRSLASAM